MFSYLSFQVELAEADEISTQLMMEDAPTLPEEYLLLTRLRVFSGPNGALPLLVDGGWLDQPYLTVLTIEACVSGERRFEALMKRTRYNVGQAEQ